MSQFRCAVDSLTRAEPMAGTASTVRAFLLIEEPGPWGVDAMRDARLPDQLGPILLAKARTAGVRPLLIRRAGRPDRDTRRIVAAHADPDQPWLESTTVKSLAEVLDIDFAGLGAGTSAGLDRREDPVFAVCTHGRHDACCAELGRPVAAALATAYPDHAWEVSHIGGDRFAGNLLVLPHGLYYGRVGPLDAPRIASGHLAGELDLEHLRGRSGLPMPVQAAECALRRAHRLVRNDELRFLGATTDADRVTTASFLVRESTLHDVEVRTTPGDAARLTCRAATDRVAPVYEVVELTPRTP